MVAAAIVGSAVVGAAATTAAAGSAASATQNATNAAVSEQDKALAQQKELAAPYTGLGQLAIPKLESLLGLNGQDPTAALRATPGYQFQLNQGLDATKAQANAMGLGLSGNTLEALDKFSTGLADSTYQQAVGNAENAVGIGQAAAAGQAANIGNAANNVSSLVMNQGNTLAGIDANLAAGLTKTVGNATDAYITSQTLKGLTGG